MPAKPFGNLGRTVLFVTMGFLQANDICLANLNGLDGLVQRLASVQTSPPEIERHHTNLDSRSIFRHPLARDQAGHKK